MKPLVQVHRVVVCALFFAVLALTGAANAKGLVSRQPAQNATSISALSEARLSPRTGSAGESRLTGFLDPAAGQVMSTTGTLEGIGLVQIPFGLLKN